MQGATRAGARQPHLWPSQVPRPSRPLCTAATHLRQRAQGGVPGPLLVSRVPVVEVVQAQEGERSEGLARVSGESGAAGGWVA